MSRTPMKKPQDYLTMATVPAEEPGNFRFACGAKRPENFGWLLLTGSVKAHVAISHVPSARKA